jgi:hypothetical protein
MTNAEKTEMEMGDNIKIDLREMDGSDSGSCPVGGLCH